MDKVLGEFFKCAEKAGKCMPGLVAGIAIWAMVSVVDRVCGYYGAQECPEEAGELKDIMEEELDIE